LIPDTHRHLLETQVATLATGVSRLVVTLQIVKVHGVDMGG
jgi:hypothetical protein